MHSSLLTSVFVALVLTKKAVASVAYCSNQYFETGALGESPYQTYHAAPYLPVQLNYALPPNDCPANSQVEGYFFLAPEGPVAMPGGGLILNPNGTMIYSASAFEPSFLRGLQSYNGSDHITIWIGDGSPVTGGHGSGYNILLDNTYTIVANFTVANLGVGADIHALQITSNNTAVMTAYPTQALNLTAYNGPLNGYILNCAAQEVDIATGRPLFTWQPLNHVDPSECYAAIGEAGSGTVDDPWDYFHINSIQKLDDGNYFISSRHCHTLYLVNPAGDILWKMGGMKSDFTFGPGANFSWQHHARVHGSNTISVFNNGASEYNQEFPYSQGLLLNFDESYKTITLNSARSPFNRTVTTSQGSVEILDNGDSFVGWGAMPYFSQHDASGNILWSAQFAPSDNEVSSYRVFSHDWVARPIAPPSMSISSPSSSTNATVYAWWNGATEVTAWQLLGSTALMPLAAEILNVIGKVDFETTLTYTGRRQYAFFQVAAMNAKGEILEYSAFTSLNGTTFSKADNQTATALPLN
ncbi:ASST-domain-containing protein [Lentinula aff. detonsa]|uniref:ASST-domain-containing protein n=1 Tax=Lentinula aff. detonsa TaxID=2804958 RepID=A0AA38K8P9_9AGAR|nr:ASST-domain-containing protein [Lentinula aff. detonsa]